MVQYAEECGTMGVRYIWDPGQQCARMDGPQLADGVNGAFMVIVNDYELELLRQKTGHERGRHPAAGGTAGGHARRARMHGADAAAHAVDVPAVAPIASKIRPVSAMRSAAVS